MWRVERNRPSLSTATRSLRKAAPTAATSDALSTAGRVPVLKLVVSCQTWSSNGAAPATRWSGYNGESGTTTRTDARPGLVVRRNRE